MGRQITKNPPVKVDGIIELVDILTKGSTAKNEKTTIIMPKQYLEQMLKDFGKFSTKTEIAGQNHYQFGMLKKSVVQIDKLQATMCLTAENCKEMIEGMRMASDPMLMAMYSL